MKTSQNLTLINIKKINKIGKKMVKLIIEEIWLKLQKQKSKNREEELEVELGKVMNIVIYIPEIQRERDKHLFTCSSCFTAHLQIHRKINLNWIFILGFFNRVTRTIELVHFIPKLGIFSTKI